MKSDLRKEIKALRFQMANLEAKCKEREDKIVELFERLEPFIIALSPETVDQILDEMKK